MINISIAILHFGEINITKKCIESIFDLNLKDINLKVLIINNDTRIEFPDIESRDSIKVLVTNNKKNNGFSGGHNQGFRFALKNECDYHVVLNNDVTLHKNLLQEMVASFKRHDNAGIISPKIYFTKGDEFHKKRYADEELGKVIWYAGGITDWKNLISKHRGVDEVDTGQYSEDSITEFATGACAMLPKKVIEKVKGFDEKYFLYYEDGDLNMRIKRLGYIPYYCAKAKMWHKNAASSGSGSELQDYFITRNRMIFGFTYAPFRTRMALIKESMKIFSKGRKWQKIGIRDFYLRKFGKGSYPIN